MIVVMLIYNGYKFGVCFVIIFFLVFIFGFLVVGIGLLKVVLVFGLYREVLIYWRIFFNFYFIGIRFFILFSSMGDMVFVEKVRGDNVGEIVFWWVF